MRQHASPALDPAVPRKNDQRRVAVAACFGTFLEWYDFLIYTVVAALENILA